MNARVLVLSALVMCPACSAGEAGDPSAQAIAAVAGDILPSNSAGISSSDLAVTAIPRGKGVVVYARNHKSPRLAWVVLNGQAYACDKQAKRLTPTLQLTSQAMWDTWKQTGLDPANKLAFFQIVDAADASRETR